METDTTYVDLGRPLEEAYREATKSQWGSERRTSEDEVSALVGPIEFDMDTLGISKSPGTIPLELSTLKASTTFTNILPRTLKQFDLSNLSLGIAELATLYSRSNETNYFDIDLIARSFRRTESCKSVTVSPKLNVGREQQLQDSFVVPSGFELIWLEVLREEENG